MKKKPVQIRMPVWLIEASKQAAASQQVCLSEFIRDAIKQRISL
ncbi:MAG: hypothetical protein ACXW1Z_19070 [Methylobacter sp.]